MTGAKFFSLLHDRYHHRDRQEQEIIDIIRRHLALCNLGSCGDRLLHALREVEAREKHLQSGLRHSL